MDSKQYRYHELMMSITDRNIDAVRRLSRRDLMNMGNENDFTPLSRAVVRDNLEIVRILVANGADIFWVNRVGSTYLHVAAQWSSIEMMEYFINAGIDINSCDNNEESPLMCAIEGHQTKIIDTIEYLLENGAKCRKTDLASGNCLHRMAYRVFKKKYSDISKCIIKHGLDVNEKDQNGDTPLHSAVWCHNPDYVSCLLENGADIDVTDIIDRTALNLAKDCKSSACKSIILEKIQKEHASTKLGAVVICEVCEDQPIKVALVPCGHLMCTECLYDVTKCPFCGSKIRERSRLIL